MRTGLPASNADLSTSPPPGEPGQEAFGYTGAIQTFTADVTGLWVIDATGAQGGKSGESLGPAGGLGAEIKGTFPLTAGQTLSVFVGGMGAGGSPAGPPPDNGSAAGGGGGTFVVGPGNTPLVIAGGGGGGAGSFSAVHGGLAGTAGGAGSSGGAGGTNGSGGFIGPSNDFNNNGGGGGGFSGDGGNGDGGGGHGFPSLAGGLGTVGGAGGFGGGGGGAFGGGGGGGFSGGGGGGGNYGGGGGGGGSFLATGATYASLVANVHAGNGSVMFGQVVTPPEETLVPEPDSLATRFINNTRTGAWGDPRNWSNGIPQPGDTAVIRGGVAQTFDLNLSEIDVQLARGYMVGDALTLTDSQITDTSGAYAQISQSELALDEMSFVGVPEGSEAGAHFHIGVSEELTNRGTIGASAAGTNTLVISGGDFENDGKLIVANGADAHIQGMHVSGSGEIAVSNQGSLSLDGSTVDSGQELDLGCQSGAVLAFDPALSSIAAALSGFDATDLIELWNFSGTVTRTDGENPTLTFTSDVPSESPASFSLNLRGSYTDSVFALAGDATGTGSILTVDHS